MLILTIVIGLALSLGDPAYAEVAGTVNLESEVTYIITATAGPGGSLYPSGEVNVAHGSDQTFDIVPDTGYHIVSTVAGGTYRGLVSSFTFTNVTQNLSINSTFDINSYLLTIDSYGGDVIRTPNQLFIDYGETVTLEAIADANFTFTGWSGDLSGNDNPVTFVMDGTKNIKANFYIDATYAVTASAGQNGAISPQGVTGVAYGEDITYTITPDPGYYIEDVVIDGVFRGGYSSYTFENVVEPHTINAQFTVGDTNNPMKPQLFDTAFELPAEGNTWIVEDTGNADDNGIDLQDKINNADLGDTIILEAGASFNSPKGFPLRLPAKTGRGWIYIISSELDQLTEGKRVGPDDSIHMPKIISSGTSNGLPAMITLFGAHHYRFAGIEFRTDGPCCNLILQGSGFWHDGDSYWTLRSANSYEELPHHIVYDRCYLHSTSDRDRTRTAINANGQYIAVIDSHISNFKDTGAGEGHGIELHKGAGPFKFVNNFIEASGENIIVGGTDTPIENNIPSDFEVRGNYFYKPLKWKYDSTTDFGILGEVTGSLSGDGNLTFTASLGAPFSGLLAEAAVSLYTSGDAKASIFGYVDTVSEDGTSITVDYWTNFNDHLTPDGTQNRVRVNPRFWTIKNHFETKNAQRVLVTGNIFENSWWHFYGGQRGSSLVLKSANQNGGNPWAVTQDITYTNNIVRHVGRFAALTGGAASTGQTQRILIKNNIAEDIGRVFYSNSTATIVNTPNAPILDLIITNNLILHNGTGNSFMVFESPSAQPCAAQNFQFENNIFTLADYGIKGTAKASGNSSLDYFITNLHMNKNLIINRPGDRFYPVSPTSYPPDNFMVNNISEVGFTDYSGKNYRLSEASPYKNAATDGKDIGPEIDAIIRATRGAISGDRRTGIPGDINADNRVDILDLIIVARAFGSVLDGSGWDARADIDGNGIVDIIDLITVAQDFGKGT